MTCEPHWTTYLSALLVPAVAIFGGIIAYLQWRTTQNKLKLDLFEKRFSVYDTARKLLESIVINGTAKNEEIFKFQSGTREAKWLLNDEIAKYFKEEIFHNALELQTLDAELEGVSASEIRNPNRLKHSEIRKWIKRQYEVLDLKFSQFLQLKH